MDRRKFLHLTSAAAIAAQGYLPLLAAERKAARRRTAQKKGNSGVSNNPHTEPPAIEPVTGYHLENFMENPSSKALKRSTSPWFAPRKQ